MKTADVDEQLMQHSEDFFDTIFSEVFRENGDCPISREQFDNAVDAIGIEVTEQDQFTKLYEMAVKSENGSVSKTNLTMAIY